MDALALHAELLRGANCEGHRIAATGGLCRFGNCTQNDPHIAVAYDIVSSIRHDFLQDDVVSTAEANPQPVA